MSKPSSIILCIPISTTLAEICTEPTTLAVRGDEDVEPLGAYATLSGDVPRHLLGGEFPPFEGYHRHIGLVLVRELLIKILDQGEGPCRPRAYSEELTHLYRPPCVLRGHAGHTRPFHADAHAWEPEGAEV